MINPWDKPIMKVYGPYVRTPRKPKEQCGTLRSYNKGCKCDRCKTANAKYTSMNRAGNKPSTTDVLA